ncbi:MAG: helix-turn-helix domain-containing protein [Crocinitomicaceae bacterium]|nr:helix-turn-helix domain-containing protein [Crocinitomicaceae bacterium]
MESIYYVSVAFETAIAFACLIFIFLLLATKLLPKLVTRYGILLFANLMFIALFYMIIHIGWVNVAIPLIWLFVPSTITVGLFFYRFNTVWLNHSFKIDRFITFVPLVVLVAAITFEILNVTVPDNMTIYNLRLAFTENTLKYLFPIYSGLLIVLNFLKLRKAEQLNRENHTAKDVVNLNWSRVSLLFYVIFYFGMIISEVVSPFISEFIFNISILVLVLYLGYYQIKVIAKYLRTTKEHESINDDEQRPELSSTPMDGKLDELFQSINELVESEELYLKFDISIHELGKRMNMNSKYLSQAINSRDGLNFNRFINQKRVKHASELILDEAYSTYTLEGIGKESGFRSKSTFNTTFKTIIGCTPSEYKKKN